MWVTEFARRNPPAINASAATGTSHADNDDQPAAARARALRQAFFQSTAVTGRHFDRLFVDHDSSIMRSSEYSAITLRVPSSTDLQCAHV